MTSSKTIALIASVLSLFIASIASAVPTVVNLLTDEFEGYTPGAIPAGLPSTATINPPPPGAQGDPSEITGSYTQGGDTVNPRSGSQMMRFINTYYLGDPGIPGINEGTNGDVYYLLDLTSYAASIATGTASITMSAWFNTGATSQHTDPGDPNFNKVDNSYFLGLIAWSGELIEFPEAGRLVFSSPDYLTGAITYDTPLLTDRLLNTWEEATVTLDVPAGTKYISARLGAHENFYQTSLGEDLISSFVDDVEINLELPNGFMPNPEPSGMAVPESGSSIFLLSLAIFGLTVARPRAQRKSATVS